MYFTITRVEIKLCVYINVRSNELFKILSLVKKNSDRAKLSLSVFNDLKKFDIYHVHKWLANVRFQELIIYSA